MSSGWIVQEWPHSRALGERWIAFPPRTPQSEPWPGLRFFATEGAARAHAREPITDLNEVRIITVRIDGKPVDVWVHADHAKPDH